jgi:gentisate 1,2-dioxygenase
VQDSSHSSALDQLNDELDGLALEGHWRLQGVTAPEPRPWAAAHVWRWAEIRRVLLRAGEIGGIEGGASRRTVRLCTPGLPEKFATQTVHASFQLVKPGEIAEAHRHSMGALRFIAEGEGGYTTVNGEKFVLEPGDLILTPQMSWHDHGNEGAGPVLWLDGHDFPLAHRLNALFFEPYATQRQEVVADDRRTRARLGPVRQRGLVNDPAGCPFIYKGAEAMALIASLDEGDWDAHDGFALDYTNPVNGGPTLPTIGCRLQRFPTGRRTLPQRETVTRICQVVRGRGRTVAGDKVLEWGPGDPMVLPGWHWVEHEASEDAILFSMSDEPVLRALALYRCERAEGNRPPTGRNGS